MKKHYETPEIETVKVMITRDVLGVSIPETIVETGEIIDDDWDMNN